MTTPGYALYVAGSDTDEAREAKRTYIAGRRAAGKESMSGYTAPQVEYGAIPTILLRPTQVAIMAALALDGADTTTIARRSGVTAETVRRHLRVICDVLGYDDRAGLVVALLQGQVKYRAVR